MNCFEDWKAWFNKLKWQFISFKFLAFFTVLSCVVGAWFGLERLFLKSVSIAETLFEKEYITKDGVKEIVTHSQSVLYDMAFNHLMVGSASVLAAIIAIKGVAYVMNSKQTRAVIEKTSNGDLQKNIKTFLPKHGGRT